MGDKLFSHNNISLNQATGKKGEQLAAAFLTAGFFAAGFFAADFFAVAIRYSPRSRS